MLIGGGYKTIVVWDTATGRTLRTLRGLFEWVNFVALEPDGTTLISADNTSVEAWNIKTGKNLRRLLTTNSPDFVFALSPDGKTLACNDSNKSVSLIDVTSGIEKKLWAINPGQMKWPNMSIAFSPDGETLATSTDQKIQLWKVAAGQEVQVLNETSGSIFSIAFSPDGKTLIDITGGTARFWDVASGKMLRMFAMNQGITGHVALRAGGKTIAVGDNHKTVKLWDITTGKELCKLDGYRTIEFSPDGTKLAADGGPDQSSVKVWDIASDQQLARRAPVQPASAKSSPTTLLPKAVTDANKQVVEAVSAAINGDQKSLRYAENASGDTDRYVDGQVINDLLDKGNRQAKKLYRNGHPELAVDRMELVFATSLKLVEKRGTQIAATSTPSKWIEAWKSEGVGLIPDQYQEPLNDYGFYLQQCGKDSEAIPIFEAVLHDDGTRAVAYLNLADSQWKLGKTKEAKQNYAKYISLVKSQKLPGTIPKSALERAGLIK